LSILHEITVSYLEKGGRGWYNKNGKIKTVENGGNISEYQEW